MKYILTAHFVKTSTQASTTITIHHPQHNEPLSYISVPNPSTMGSNSQSCSSSNMRVISLPRSLDCCHTETTIQQQELGKIHDQSLGFSKGANPKSRGLRVPYPKLITDMERGNKELRGHVLCVLKWCSPENSPENASGGGPRWSMTKTEPEWWVFFLSRR